MRLRFLTININGRKAIVTQMLRPRLTQQIQNLKSQIKPLKFKFLEYKSTF